MVGGESAVQVGRGAGLPEDRLIVVTPGETLTLGAYDVTLIEATTVRRTGFRAASAHPSCRRSRSLPTSGEAWSTLIITGHRSGGC